MPVRVRSRIHQRHHYDSYYPAYGKSYQKSQHVSISRLFCPRTAALGATRRSGRERGLCRIPQGNYFVKKIIITIIPIPNNNYTSIVYNTIYSALVITAHYIY